MTAGGLERRRKVSIAYVASHDRSEPSGNHDTAAFPMTTDRSKRACDLKTVARYEAPAVERGPMLASMLGKKLGEGVSQCVLATRLALKRHI